MITLCLLFVISFAAGIIATAHRQVCTRASLAQLQKRIENQGASAQVLRQKVQNLEYGLMLANTQLQRHENASGGFWTTGNGTVLRIRDMTLLHIDQSIEWCKENGRDTSQLRAERSRRNRNSRMWIKR